MCKTPNDNKETLQLQGEEVNRHERELKDIFRRLEAAESNLLIQNGTEESTEETWATRATRGQEKIQNIVKTQMDEQAEIEKIKKNLVLSGMKEMENEEEDKTNVLTLLEQHLDVTADISTVERMGKPRKQKPGEDPPLPRLLKLTFITQRSRKEVLSKAPKLRQSADNYIKKYIYIRPDLTKRQQEDSKNLRDLLGKIRNENPTKKYKIHRYKIIEVLSTADNNQEQTANQEQAANQE